MVHPRITSHSSTPAGHLSVTQDTMRRFMFHFADKMNRLFHGLPVVGLDQLLEPCPDANRQLFRPVAPVPVAGRRAREVHPAFAAHSQYVLKGENYRVRSEEHTYE